MEPAGRVDVRYQVPRYSGWKPECPDGAFLPQFGSDTKYRDIADGNFCFPLIFCIAFDVRYQVPRYSGWKRGSRARTDFLVHVRYQVPRYSGWKLIPRDRMIIAPVSVRYQVPRYSGWKRLCLDECRSGVIWVGNQVPRYSGWKLIS